MADGQRHPCRLSSIRAMAASAVKRVTGQCVELLGKPVAQSWICASRICMVCHLYRVCWRYYHGQQSGPMLPFSPEAQCWQGGRGRTGWRRRERLGCVSIPRPTARKLIHPSDPAQPRLRWVEDHCGRPGLTLQIGQMLGP
jgi:hypothetical protein